MEVTMTELVLFGWALIATGMWLDAKKELHIHRMMTLELMKRIAKGRIKVVEHNDSFELKDVK